MSALPPIATAKAKFRKRSCPLYPQKQTCAVRYAMSALGHKRTLCRLRLGGCDGDSLLLTRIGDVRHRGALHVAFPPQVVELRAAVHGAAIVPDNQVMNAPPMGVDELPLGGMGDELVDQRAAVRLRHAEDAAGMRGEVKRFAASLRDGSHERLRHRWHILALLVAELREAEASAGVED